MTTSGKAHAASHGRLSTAWVTYASPKNERSHGPTSTSATNPTATISVESPRVTRSWRWKAAGVRSPTAYRVKVADDAITWRAVVMMSAT